MATLGPGAVSEPTCSLRTRGVALSGIAPPFHAQVASLVLRVPIRGLPVPSTLSRSLGPLAYSGRLPQCPGCPLLGTQLPKPRSQPVNFTLAPLQMGIVPSLNINNKTTILFVNLSNPLTNIKLTPGSLGWESLLPPLIHSHHAFHIHSIHTQARWPILTHYTFSFHFSIHSILCLCSPNYLVLPRHPLN